MISKTKKLGKKLASPLYLIILFVVITCIVGVFFLVQSRIPKSRVLYHGPNPITMGKVIKSEYVLGRSTFLQRKRTVRVTPTVRPPTPTIRPPTPTTQPPTPTVPKPTSTSIPPTPTIQASNQAPPQVSAKAGEYGIAAGGGLIWLGQSDLNIYFSNLQSLGIKWVRWDIDWGAVQPNNSTSYSWEGPDRVAATAKKYGINSLGIITYAPKWAADQSCNADFVCAPADPKAFGHFAGTVALRYKDSIVYWEIWNEPNIPFFWSPKPDAQKYTEILREAYTEIKKNSPPSFVLSGGLSPSGDEVDGSTSPLTFLKALYGLGANQYFDAVALHPYSYPVSPNYVAVWNSWQQMTSVRQLMISKGESAKKIWVTEYGAPTGGPGSIRDLDQLTFTYGSDYMSETAQREMAQQAIALYSKDADWMGPFFWYSLHDNGTSKDTPENFFGLMRNDWSKKPAYDVFRNMIVSN